MQAGMQACIGACGATKAHEILLFNKSTNLRGVHATPGAILAAAASFFRVARDVRGDVRVPHAAQPFDVFGEHLAEVLALIVQHQG